MLFLNPFASYLFARRAVDERAVAKLISDTGSTLTPEGIGYYSRLFQNARHIDATLGMMAHWDLAGLAQDLPDLRVPLVLCVADKDTAVPPADAITVRGKLPSTEIIPMTNLGHLAHEEAPVATATLLLDIVARKVGPPQGSTP
jgi:magnesium chelatase accessory protein